MPQHRHHRFGAATVFTNWLRHLLWPSCYGPSSRWGLLLWVPGFLAPPGVGPNPHTTHTELRSVPSLLCWGAARQSGGDGQRAVRVGSLRVPGVSLKEPVHSDGDILASRLGDSSRFIPPRVWDADGAIRYLHIGHCKSIARPCDKCNNGFRKFREADRLADVMADEGWIPWIAIPTDREALRVGERVLVRHSEGDSLATVAEADEADRYWGRFNVHLDRDRPNVMTTVPSAATILRWVPVPVDGATLGLHPCTAALTLGTKDHDQHAGHETQTLGGGYRHRNEH